MYIGPKTGMELHYQFKMSPPKRNRPTNIIPVDRSQKENNVFL